jgi:hypothetical protein
MGKRVQRSLLLVGVLLACMGAVATGTAMPGGRIPQGYTRLLERQARMSVPQGSLVADCLMEQAWLRERAGESAAIPARQFEELRQFCREAARIEGQGEGIASADVSSFEREAARERVRERHRQARREFAATPDPIRK